MRSSISGAARARHGRRHERHVDVTNRTGGRGTRDGGCGMTRSSRIPHPVRTRPSAVRDTHVQLVDNTKLTLLWRARLHEGKGTLRNREDAMTKTRITAAAVAGFTLLGTGLWMYRRAEASEAPAYRYAQVERGSIQATVSATGTLGAVRTVQVGTQVSGQVSAIYADFNDKVKKGQLIARIDPTLQQQAVQDAQAGLERAQAQLALARDEYDRNKTLYDAQIVTASEFGTVQSNYTVAKANVKSAQISLDRARQNLAYTNVYAPIDGVVVERNVDVGQTVAASLSAPQLFLIA